MRSTGRRESRVNEISPPHYKCRTCGRKTIRLLGCGPKFAFDPAVSPSLRIVLLTPPWPLREWQNVISISCASDSGAICTARKHSFARWFLSSCFLSSPSQGSLFIDSGSSIMLLVAILRSAQRMSGTGRFRTIGIFPPAYQTWWLVTSVSGSREDSVVDRKVLVTVLGFGTADVVPSNTSHILLAWAFWMVMKGAVLWGHFSI